MKTQQLGGIMVLIALIVSAVIFRTVTEQPETEAVRAERDALEIARLAAQRQNLQRANDFKFYGGVVLLSSVCSAFILLGAGFFRQKSIVTQRIGDTEIKVRYKEMPFMVSILQVIATAKELESRYPERAFQLFDALVENQVKQLSVLSRFKSLQAPATPPVTMTAAATIEIPSFSDMVQGLRPGDNMILGYDLETGEPIEGTFDSLYSSFLAGRSGSGKSSWLRGLILQSLVVYPDSTFYILDPHSHHDESLSKSLPSSEHFTVLTEGAQGVKTGIHAFNRLLQHRLDSGIVAAPAVFVCDELSFCSKQKYGQTLSILLERIANEGRKAKCYALLSSQDCRVKRSGDFRDMLSSSYTFQIKAKQAGYFLQDRDEVEKVKQIHEKGVALLSPTDNESRLVKVPFCPALSGTVNQIKKPATPCNQDATRMQPPLQPGDDLQRAALAAIEAGTMPASTLAESAGINKGTLSRFIKTGRMSQENRKKLSKTLEVTA